MITTLVDTSKRETERERQRKTWGQWNQETAGVAMETYLVMPVIVTGAVLQYCNRFVSYCVPFLPLDHSAAIAISHVCAVIVCKT